MWNFKNTRTKNALNEKKCCTTIKINFEISKTHPVSELYLDPDVDVWVGEQHPGVLLGQGVVEGDVALDLGLQVGELHDRNLGSCDSNYVSAIKINTCNCFISY